MTLRLGETGFDRAGGGGAVDLVNGFDLCLESAEVFGSSVGLGLNGSLGSDGGDRRDGGGGGGIISVEDSRS
jgi:hypothetical protein